MKKFLSVLLALAVAFTFTFGSTMSAFAGVADHAVAAKAAVTKTVNALDATNVLADKTVSGLEIEKEAWVKAYKNDYPTVLSNIINARYAEIQTKPGTDLTTEADVIAMFYEAAGVEAQNNFESAPVPANVSDLVNSIYATVDDEAAGYEFDTVKEEALVILAKVDISEFSKTTPVSTDGSKVYTYYERADKVVKDAIASIEAAGFDGADPTVATAASLINGIGYVAKSKYTNVTDTLPTETPGAGYLGIVSEKFNPNGTTTGTYVLSTAGRTDSTGTIKNTTEEAADAAGLDAKKESLKSLVASKGSSYVTTVSTTLGVTTDQIKAAQTAKEQYVKAYSYLIDAAKTAAELKTNLNAAGTTVAQLEAAIEDLNGTMAAKLAANEILVADLNTYAAKCKAEVDVTGAKVRDEKLVNESVQASTIDAYKKSVATQDWDGLTAAKADVRDNCYITAADIEYARQVALAAVEADRAEALENYYEKEQAAVNAAFDKVVDAIKAANTQTDLDRVPDVNVTGIKTASQVRAAISSYVSLSKHVGYQTTLNAGIAKVENQRTFENATIAITGTDNTANMTQADYWKEFYAVKGARTEAEVTALWSEAIAAMEAVPTNKAVSDAKEAAETAINGLPAALKVTDSDEAAIKAAFDAAQAYAEMVGVADYTASLLLNKDKLTADINALATIEKNEIAIAASKIPSQLTIADKAAVKAIAEAQKAFNDKVDEDSTDMYKVAGVDPINPTNSDDMATIRALEAKAVKAAIDAIPFNVTADSKAAVEAARATYDAFVKEYTTYEADAMYGDNGPYDAASVLAADPYNVNLKALEDAEKEIAALAPAYDNQDAKADLLDMSRKLTIWRTSKTSIKVTAVGSVKNIKANGYTVKYSFYKKAPGATSYKLIKTTTSNKYTYTNLKKGTNKFQVKVKVYDADGKLVATKMTYYRAAKIK